MEHFAGDQLKATVHALADDIGPRPPGSPQEEQARAYLEAQLAAAGITDVERIPFPTVDSWGYGMIAPVLTALLGNGIGRRQPLIGGALVGLSTHAYWQMAGKSSIEKQILYPLYPKHPGGTLFARIPPAGEVKQRVVLIGHTDTNRHRTSFDNGIKKAFIALPTSVLAALAANTVGTLLGWKRLRNGSSYYLIFALGALLLEEVGGFVDGANDNASAVACTLGVGKQAMASPLQHTEIWLAFTGSEEVGLVGLNALLDQHGETLRDAWFIDFELVGAGKIAYVSRHSGFTAFSSYTPDGESLALAALTSEKYPELDVHGREVVMGEEVATLRQRGYRGICLVGLDDEGWLPNWHRYSDNSANIDPEPLETAARFAWGMVSELDERARR